MKQTIFYWVSHHGYAGLFSLLVLGIIGLPVPDEWLLTLCGYFVFRNTFRFVPTLAAGFLGSICGITVSYALGRTLGTLVLVRYGARFRITQHEVDRVHQWFKGIGHWTLTFGYFVPGVRHLTAYVAGASGVELPVFVGFACAGGFLWSLSFISLGYFLGERWESISDLVHHTGLLLAVLGAAGIGVYVWRRRNRTNIGN
jgi:membrane protein DedA with SNARE-associated domain